MSPIPEGSKEIVQRQVRYRKPEIVADPIPCLPRRKKKGGEIAEQGIASSSLELLG
jgi:hypothetical protein